MTAPPIDLRYRNGGALGLALLALTLGVFVLSLAVMAEGAWARGLLGLIGGLALLSGTLTAGAQLARPCRPVDGRVVSEA